jgi:Protein O-mannosyl-transferase TMEM260-like
MQRISPRVILGRVLSYTPSRSRSRIAGVLLAVGCAATYLALLPPLYNRDGYVYRLYALHPSRWHNINPHHLLWDYVQILLAELAVLSGHPTTVPFQVFGIVVNCTALFLFFVLLRDVTGSRLLSAAGVLLVAFSPKFWFLGFQNQPYPLVFLLVVLYLLAWREPKDGPPVGARLVAAAVCLGLAIFFHQAVVVLIPAAIAVMILYGRDAPARSAARGLIWGAAIVAVVIAGYVGCWHTLDKSRPGFVRWVSAYLATQHRPQLEFPGSLARAVMGISGSLVQTERLKEFLGASLSEGTILFLYLGFGLFACLAVVALARRKGGRRAMRLLRSNALFTVSLLSIVCWSAFVLAWEPATPYYWVLNLFPALVCLGLLLRDSPLPKQRAFAIAVVLVSGWNIYFNRDYDQLYSRNFPPPLLASIKRHVAASDIFITLGNGEWYGDVDYDLLFACLKYWPRNLGVAILDDFVLPDGPVPWRKKLGEKIDNTLDSGDRVFVAAHVFDPDTYADLSNAGDAFAPSRQPAVCGASKSGTIPPGSGLFSRLQAEQVEL